MKQIFNDYEIVITTEDRVVEGETISLKVFLCLKAREKGRCISRKVRYDKEAGDMYIRYNGKKYFYSEFE